MIWGTRKNISTRRFLSIYISFLLSHDLYSQVNRYRFIQSLPISIKMQYKTFALLLLGISEAHAQSGTSSGTASASNVYVTQTVTGYITYCPESTTFTTNGQTYTATTSQWITVTNCPCTISNVPGKPITVVPVGSQTPYLNTTSAKTTAAAETDKTVVTVTTCTSALATYSSLSSVYASASAVASSAASAATSAAVAASSAAAKTTGTYAAVTATSAAAAAASAAASVASSAASIASAAASAVSSAAAATGVTVYTSTGTAAAATATYAGQGLKNTEPDFAFGAFLAAVFYFL